MSIWNELFRERLEQNLHIDYLRGLLNVFESIELDLKDIAASERQRLQVEAQIKATLDQILVTLRGQSLPAQKLVFHLGTPVGQK